MPKVVSTLGKKIFFPDSMADDAIKAAMPDVSKKLTAWHGSPHEFEKFRMSQIGTGEGAQAYGHGLYFAEHPQTAREYQKALSGSPDVQRFVEGSVIKDPIAKQQVSGFIADEIGRVDGDIPKAKAILREKAANWRRASGGSDDVADDLDAALDSLPDNFEMGKGSLYKVNINATPDELLDWDKPLSEQPQSIKDALRKANPTLGYGLDAENWLAVVDDVGVENTSLGREPLGSDIYQALSGGGGGRTGETGDAATELLNNHGIKGIQYDDAMSRGVGGGTKNFVIFDENLIDIAERNGIPMDEVNRVAQESGVSPKQALSMMLGGTVAIGAMTPDEAQAGIVSTGKKAIESGSKLAMDYASRMKRAEAGVVGQAKRIPDLMQPFGKSKMVGNEKLILDDPDFKIFEADPDYKPKGAGKNYRYVKYQDGEPVSVLQFGTHGPKSKKATIQNVQTLGDSQRQGHAKSLLERARMDFDVRHSDDLTDKGRAWSEAVPSITGAVGIGALGGTDTAQASTISPYTQDNMRVNFPEGMTQDQIDAALPSIRERLDKEPKRVALTPSQKKAYDLLSRHYQEQGLDYSSEQLQGLHGSPTVSPVGSQAVSWMADYLRKYGKTPIDPLLGGDGALVEGTAEYLDRYGEGTFTDNLKRFGWSALDFL